MSKPANGLPSIPDLFGLSGKVAAVTGAGQGIGFEIARYLAAAGARVAMLDRNAEIVEHSAASLQAAGAGVLALPVDISDEDQVTAAIHCIVREYGCLDIMVNNAGLQDRELLLDTSAALWDRLHSVNARGVFLCVREAAKAMIAGAKGGRIVNISSLGTLNPMVTGLAAYSSSKGAVSTLTRNAAFELAQHDILVNAVLPGGVATPGARDASGPVLSGRGIEPAILGRPVGPHDIAGMVLFLAGPSSGVITGQTFVVDAGYTLG